MDDDCWRETAVYPSAAAAGVGRVHCISISRKLLFEISTERERLASHMASATWPLVPGERQLGGGRTDAMSVSFDAITTAPVAIWRPIAALRLTRCHSRPNSTRITLQLGKHIGLYSVSAHTTDRWPKSWLISTCYLVQLRTLRRPMFANRLQLKNRNSSRQWSCFNAIN